MNAEKITTYYFIRHAEKDTSDTSQKDPALSEAGKERAIKWAAVFKDVEFDFIYSSNFKRTRETVQPVAKSQGLKVLIYDFNRLNDKDFQLKTSGKKVLVVGHTNTNPKWVNAILGKEKYHNIDEEESGSLFIVTVLPNGNKDAQVLYIN